MPRHSLDIYQYLLCCISVSEFAFVARGSLRVVPYCPLAAALPDCCRNLNVQFWGCWVSWKLWCCFCWFIQVSKSKTTAAPFRNLFSPVSSSNRSICRTSMSANATENKLLIIILGLKNKYIVSIFILFKFLITATINRKNLQIDIPSLHQTNMAFVINLMWHLLNKSEF